MTSTELKKLETVLRNRIETARRWQKLTDTDAIADAVWRDPDVTALRREPDVQKALGCKMIEKILTAKDDDELAHYRNMFGDELVDKILRLAADNDLR